MARVDDRLDDLRQEVIETRNQTIKTDNALRNLVGDIKAIARRQEAYESRLWVNSAYAYLTFAVATFIGLFLFFRAGVERAALERDLVDQQIAALDLQIRDLEAAAQQRRQAEGEAYAFFELLVSGRREEIVERFPTVQGRLVDRATIELFRREVDRIRGELALEGYQLGMDAHADEQWETARDALLRSLAYVEIAPYSAELHYALGDTLFALDDDAGAVRHFDIALSSPALGRAEAIIATFRRAEALRRLDRDAEAAAGYRDFAERFGGHHWAPTARQRAASLSRND